MKKTLLLSFIISFLFVTSKAQTTFSFNCPKDTTIDCLQNCVTLTTKVPDVKAFTDDYGVNLTSGGDGCFRPPVSPSIPGTSTNLDRDDLYTPVIPMPFDFPFYGIIYAQLIVNTNGIISFDLSQAGLGAQWTILNGEGTLPTDAYDRAIIMGAYHDIDIQFPNTSPTKQIKYDVIGTAPHRKWVLTFYKVPCFQNTCWSKINNTYQITLYEGLGLVDVHVFGREICTTWNNGNAMIGMQNYDQDKGIMAPGREAFTTPRWGSPTMNESWRFTPKTGPTLFKKVELTDMSGNLVAEGDTASDGNNGLNVTFDNVCLNSTTQYVVKTHYYNFQYPFQFPASDSIVYSTDTFTVYKASAVPPITLTTTAAQCGANPNGTITVTAPVGPNFVYSIDGGGSYQPSPVFSVPAGTYTVTVLETSGSCTRDTTVTISAPTTLSGTATSTNTSCPEALNGTITVTGVAGTGTYTYAVDNITAPVFVATNTFTGLSAGDHTVLVQDGAACIFSFTHTVLSDAVFTSSGTSVNATCLGALNGSLTADVPSAGQAPFTYSIPGGAFAAFQSSPTFTGLAGDSTYTVNVKDDLGCVSVFTQAVGFDPGITSNFTVRNASCFGVDNGHIVLVPSGGTAPYFYQVDTGSAPTFVALDTIRNLGAGLYDVTVRDNIGCIFNLDDISVISGTGVNATFTVNPTACATASTGSIIFNTNFSGVSPFEYSVNNAAFQPFFGTSRIDTATNLSAGNYVIQIRDGVGCLFQSQPLTVSAGPDIQASFVTIPTACAVATTGQIVVTPITGAGPFNYNLDNTVFVALTDTIRNLDSGFHSIIITDAIGCSTTINPEITLGTGVNATFTTVNSACTAASTGRIIATVTSGIAPFTYSTDAGVIFNPLDTIRNLAEGVYNILIRDAAGCEFSSPVTVSSDNPGVGATITTVNSACAGVSTGQIIITPTIGIAPFTYSTDAGVTYLPLDTIRNLAGNTYTIRVRDALGCAYDAPPVTVSSNPGVSATFTTINSACTAASTGSIAASVTAGTAPFTYSIDAGVNFYALDTIRNLSEGSYTVLIRDAVGCEFTSPVTVSSNNPGVGATFVTVNSACTGVSTGQIIITPTVGIAPFSYSTDAGVTYLPLDTIRNLAGNTYTIRVRDGLGCAYDAPPVTVGNNAGVAATFITENSACAVASTGRIIPAVSSGTAPFSYSIDGGTSYLPLDTIRNLSGGAYTVLIRDAVGCQFTAPVTVNSNNPGVGATFVTVNSACTGVSTGQIIITPTIGIAPFSYSTDAGVTYLPLDTIRNLAGNTYTIRVRDGLGCAYDAPPVTVGNNAGVAATFITENSACAVASTGRIIPAVSSGTAPFSYSIDGGTSYLPLDTIRNLSGGAYTVLIRDAVGCQFTAPVTVNSNNPGVGATFATVNSACTGVSTGKIIITPTTGIAPFTYSTNGGANYFPLDTIRNLASNTYNIRVRDALGCAYDAPAVTVGNDIGVTADFAIVNSACAAAATGAIIVEPLTGTVPFVFSIDAGGSYKADNVFRNLAANAYNVRVRDAVGCIFNSPVQNVGNQPGVLTNASTIQNASCASIPNGTITVNVTAGISPLTYVITSPVSGTPQSGNQFTSLSSGTYSITITDSAGCTNTITSIVGNNPKVQIDSLNIVRPACNGLQNGTVTVNVSLGVAPYQYAIDGGTFGTSKTFSTVGAGVHTLSIRDANNCSIDSVITISEPAVLTASILSTQAATCSGNPDGKIVSAASGGTLPYQYSVDSPTNTGYQAVPTFDVLKGNYVVTVIDDKGCLATANATVDSVFTMYLDLGTADTICSGSSLTLNPNTNPETSEFIYTPAASLDLNNVKNPVASPTQTTTYTVTAKWGICTLTDNITINVLRKPIADAGNDVIICFDTTTELKATASNLSGTVNFTWSPSNLLDTKADSTSVTVRPQDENTYFVVTVRDEYNCNFAVSDSVLVKMLPPVYAFAGNDTNAVLNKAHQLTATGAGAGGSYVWDYPSGVNLSDRTDDNPTAIFVPVPGIGEYSPIDTNYYWLSVTATNAAGCKATDSIRINVFIGPTNYVPNAFSPNGDGINDIFKPINVGSNIEYFRVFNRYGEIVFQTSRFRDGWNGFFKGKEQPAGAYVWVYKGKDSRGREIIEKGTVMLVR
ncbi:MAG TPA: gliding motility-associated C-terminal domain-containing protein [Ferruginibacter sp.]|nr:gliding motility-associated C-terminal domain-containing protein [Ferruginibacter sp.]